MDELVLASSNAHKLAELREMLQQSKLEVKISAMQEHGKPPQIIESASDFHGNAALKSEGIAQWLKQIGGDSQPRWVLADDSGLCVDALDGAPGVHSARFAGERASDADNNRKLVEQLKLRSLTHSPARFCCVLALTELATLKTVFFEGEARGEARVQASGNGGFGYDPHIWLQGEELSFAEMSRKDKSKVSHRGRALAKFLHAFSSMA